jgi:hypothetical protein
VAKPTTTAANDQIASSDGPDGGPRYPGRNPPVWHKFVNLFVSGGDLFFDNEYGDEFAALTGSAPDASSSGGSGGLLSNLDNAYTYAFISRSFGPLVVLRGRAPTAPDTRDAAPTMPSGKQLRYWSFCQNEPFTQRFVDCLADDQVAVGKTGDYTIVVSTPGRRPKNATARCGVSWMAWGPHPQGVLIYRHMLPDPGFAQAIQHAEYGTEEATMGAYYPRAEYTDRASFEKLGCRKVRSRRSR